MRQFSLGLLLLWLTGFGSANAANPEGGGIRLYSDLCYHEESGDVLGTRIGLLELEDGPYVIYQEAFGWPGKAQMIKLEKGDFENSRIVFSVEDNGGADKFRGAVSAKRITGRFDGHRVNSRGNSVFNLDRVKLPQKGFPDCR